MNAKTDARSLALHQRINDSVVCAGKTDFGDQTLLTFHEVKSHPSKLSRSLPVDPSLVDLVIGVDRNAPKGQLYSITDLHNAYHGTIPKSDFGGFISLAYPPLPSTSNQTGIRQMRYIHVTNNTNYVCRDDMVVVINNGMKWCKDQGATTFNETRHDMKDGQCTEMVKVEDPILYCTWEVFAMFECGLSDLFSYDRKKRSGVQSGPPAADQTIPSHVSFGFSDAFTDGSSHFTKPSRYSTSGKGKKRRSRKKRSKAKKKSTTRATGSSRQSPLPTITLGWLQTDAHEYKNNKVSIAGNIQPFIRDGSLTPKARLHLLNCIRCAVAAMPKGCSVSLEDEEDKEMFNLRAAMISEFERSLGGKGEWMGFEVEGVTILIPLSVGFHKDTFNCSRDGMKAVIQINCRVPMNSTTINGGRSSVLWRWLESNGYKEFFPCLIILYSRKCVSGICLKLAEMNRFAKRDSLRRVLKWAFIERVNSTVNYEVQVWNNSSFLQQFLSDMKTDHRKGLRSYQGAMLKQVAYYQKIAFYSIFIHVFLSMNIKFKTFTVADAMDYVAYCGLTCNGSTLIAEIERRIIKDPPRYLKLLSSRFNNCMYSLLCFVNSEIMPGSATGSCTDNRFTYSQGSNDTHWGQKRKMLFNVCQEFYKDKQTSSRQSTITEKIREITNRIVHGKVSGKSEFCGVGAMSANQFIHLASLVGLIPLYCFTFADIHDTKLGPAKAISIGLEQPKMRLPDIRTEFSGIVQDPFFDERLLVAAEKIKQCEYSNVSLWSHLNIMNLCLESPVDSIDHDVANLIISIHIKRVIEFTANIDHKTKKLQILIYHEYRTMGHDYHHECNVFAYGYPKSTESNNDDDDY